MRASLVASALATATIALAPSARAQTPPQPSAPAAAPTPPPAAASPAPPIAAPPPPSSPAPPPPPSPALSPHAVFELTTLRDLHERGELSDEEYESAVRDIGGSTGEHHAGDATSLVFGKWSTTIYGFVEADTIYDSTQSFGDLAGNTQVQRPTPAPQPASQETYAGNNGQTQFSIRNTRFGLRLKPPALGSVHTSGMLEMDFLGSQTVGYGAGQVSENVFFTQPLLRVRHAMFRIETPILDILAGQYWHLFGWQGAYFPNTVEIQGLPGELYARTPQVRLSKTIKTRPVTVEVALGAMRPPSRGSVIPELEGGVRIAANQWTGMQTMGATATSIMPASIAITGDYRRFQVPAINSLVPTETVDTSSTSLAVDAFLPVIPATKETKGNSLSLTGELVYGAGIADLYSSLTGGVNFPTIPNTPATDPAMLANVPTWPQNIDNGLVNYDITGFALHPIQWTSYILGAQYYLPALQGRVWISANYSHMQSRDTSFLGNYAATSDFARPGLPPTGAYSYANSAGQLRAGEDWWDVNVFADPVPSIRVGVEFAQFLDHYVDGLTATDNRVQASGFFLF
jgi:hypothetical protein